MKRIAKSFRGEGLGSGVVGGSTIETGLVPVEEIRSSVAIEGRQVEKAGFMVGFSPGGSIADPGPRI
jgi:hypothetical protein